MAPMHARTLLRLVGAHVAHLHKWGHMPTVKKAYQHTIFARPPELAAAMDRAAATAGCALTDARYEGWFRRIIEHLGFDLLPPNRFVTLTDERREFRCYTKIVVPGNVENLVDDYNSERSARAALDLRHIMDKIQPVSPAVLLATLIEQEPDLRLFPLQPADVQFPGVIKLATGKLVIP